MGAIKRGEGYIPTIMTILVRASRRGDFPRIREMLLRAFPTNDEADLWDYLVAYDPTLTLEGVRVAVVEDRPVACTIVLSRSIRSRSDWVKGAVITLVACDPDYQRQGYGGATVRDALSWMREQDLCLGILYGHPGYYPRFGFVPMLPATRTILMGTIAPQEQPTLREVEDGDLEALCALYNRFLAFYPCAVAREPEPWIWRPRHRQSRVVLLSDQSAYALISSGDDGLSVREGAALDVGSAYRLLSGLSAIATTTGNSTMRLSLPPDHPLVRIAILNGAEQSRYAAAPGMAAVVYWHPLLPPGYRVDGDSLLYEEHVVLRCNSLIRAQLVLGYRSLDDLLLLPEVIVAPDWEDTLRRDFPPSYPHWSLAPYWH